MRKILHVLIFPYILLIAIFESILRIRISPFNFLISILSLLFLIGIITGRIQLYVEFENVMGEIASCVFFFLIFIFQLIASIKILPSKK